MNMQKIIGALAAALAGVASLTATAVAGAGNGPAMCLAGHVCMPPPAGPADGRKLPLARDEVRVSLGTYPPKLATCVGAVCAITAGYDARYVVRADRINVGQALVVLFRISDDTPIYCSALPALHAISRNPTAASAFKVRENEGSSKDPVCSCPEACRTC